MLLDTHYHLDFLASADERRELLAELTTRNVRVVAQTVTPSGFVALEGCVELLSLGFHPWYITSDQQADDELAVFAEAVTRTRFIGEIGLDFFPRRLDKSPAARQRRVFTQIINDVCAASAANDTPHVLSVHTVRSATAVLDIFDAVGLPDAHVVPVFHSFGGTSDELTRLIRMGGYLSVNRTNLKVKRGRGFVRQVPTQRLLLETDLPQPGQTSADDVTRALSATLVGINRLRGEDVSAQVRENSRSLYGVG